MSVKIKKGKGILFDAIPDSGQVMVKVAQHGRPLYIWPNRLGFPESLLPKIKNSLFPSFTHRRPRLNTKVGAGL